MPLLLATAAYLQAPVVFDEFTAWAALPPALEGGLEAAALPAPLSTLTAPDVYLMRRAQLCPTLGILDVCALMD